MRNSNSRFAVKISRGGRPALVALISVLFFFQSFLGLAQAAAGDLDPTFGTGGRVTTFFSGVDKAQDVAVQADGKIIAVGYALIFDGSRGDYEFALARYNADGSLDRTFGTEGKVITDFFGHHDQANAVSIQGDGKIIVAGSAGNGDILSTADFALARYNPDGSLDTAFGTDGKVTTDFSADEDQAFDVALQPDGKIVAAGLVLNRGTARDFALARYNANGSLDMSFGADGKVTTDFSGGYDDAYALAIQRDGKIIAAASMNSGNEFALARYNTNGSLDRTFGTDGKVTTDFPSTVPGGTDIITSLAIQSDGKIVAGGYSLSDIGNYDFALARYNPDGLLDPNFGSGGRVVTDFFGDSDHANGIAIQFNGKIVAVGEVSTPTSAPFGLVRYNTDGSLDSTFGVGGKVTTDFPGGGASADAVKIQNDGRIIAAGFRQMRGTEEFALARYLGDTPPCSVDPIPPTITCPANITAVAGASCPIANGKVVTFPNPTASDNCAGTTVVCNPPSGSAFPVGMTTVTCTATDASNNMAQCTFTVTTFPMCLQDETNTGNFVLFNPLTGDNQFYCNGVLIASGTGTPNLKGCGGTISLAKGDRRVAIVFDTTADGGKGAGTATLSNPPSTVRCQILDKDMSNNSCSAPAMMTSPETGREREP